MDRNIELDNLEQRIQRLLSESPEKKWTPFLLDPTLQPIFQKYPPLKQGPFIRLSKLLKKPHKIDLKDHRISTNYEAAILGLLENISHDPNENTLRADSNFITLMNITLASLVNLYLLAEQIPQYVHNLDPNPEMSRFLATTYPQAQTFISEKWIAEAKRLSAIRTPQKPLTLEESLRYLGRGYLYHYRYLINKNPKNLKLAEENYLKLGNIPALIDLLISTNQQEKAIATKEKYYGKKKAIALGKRLNCHQQVTELYLLNNQPFEAAAYASINNLPQALVEKILLERITPNLHPKYIRLIYLISKKADIKEKITPRLEDRDPYLAALFLKEDNQLNRAAKNFRKAGMTELDVAKEVNFSPKIALNLVNFSFQEKRIINQSNLTIEEYIKRCEDLALEALSKGLNRLASDWKRSAYRALRSVLCEGYQEAQNQIEHFWLSHWNHEKQRHERLIPAEAGLLWTTPERYQQIGISLTDFPKDSKAYQLEQGEIPKKLAQLQSEYKALQETAKSITTRITQERLIESAETSQSRKLFLRAISSWKKTRLAEPEIISKLNISFAYPYLGIQTSKHNPNQIINNTPVGVEFYARYCQSQSEWSYDLGLFDTSLQWESSANEAMHALEVLINPYPIFGTIPRPKILRYIYPEL
jgi:hypothetical protein